MLRAIYSGPFRAERRLGELMVEQPKATGLRSKGIDKNLAKRAIVVPGVVQPTTNDRMPSPARAEALLLYDRPWALP